MNFSCGHKPWMGVSCVECQGEKGTPIQDNIDSNNGVCNIHSTIRFQTFRTPYPDGLAGHHRNGTDTELAAAKAATKGLSLGCGEAMRLIEWHGAHGLTDGEGQSYFYSFPKRRCDLLHLGKIKDSGRRRPSSRGKAMIVWVVA